MISKVSFGAADSTAFTDLINRPQAYKSEPVAASKVNGDTFEKKKSKAPAIIGGVVLAAAVIATALGVLKHTGKTAQIMEQYPKLGEALDKAGGKVLGAFNAVVDAGKKFIEGFGKNAAEEAKPVEIPESIVDIADDIADDVIEAAAN